MASKYPRNTNTSSPNCRVRTDSIAAFVNRIPNGEPGGKLIAASHLADVFSGFRGGLRSAFQGPLLGRPPSCVDKILNRDISHGGSILFGKFLHACNGLAAFFECLASVILFTPSLHALQNQLVDGPEVAVADFLLNQAF